MPDIRIDKVEILGDGTVDVHYTSRTSGSLPIEADGMVRTYPTATALVAASTEALTEVMHGELGLLLLVANLVKGNGQLVPAACAGKKLKMSAAEPVAFNGPP